VEIVLSSRSRVPSRSVATRRIGLLAVLPTMTPDV
jgi:hypothetical protein